MNFVSVNNDLLKFTILGEWPRSIGARLWSLEASKDELPTCLVLTNDTSDDDKSKNDKCNNNSCDSDSEKNLSVLAHLKLTPIPSIPNACFIESVVVWQSLRGRGIGSHLMRQAEDYCKYGLKLSTIYLSTTDKEDFYKRLGYEPCNPVSIYGGPVTNTNTHASFRPNATKKKYFKKVLIQEEDDEISR